MKFSKMEVGIKNIESWVIDKGLDIVEVFDSGDEFDAFLVQRFLRSRLECAGVDFGLHGKEFVFDVGEKSQLGLLLLLFLEQWVVQTSHVYFLSFNLPVHR